MLTASIKTGQASSCWVLALDVGKKKRKQPQAARTGGLSGGFSLYLESYVVAINGSYHASLVLALFWTEELQSDVYCQRFRKWSL